MDELVKRRQYEGEDALAEEQVVPRLRQACMTIGFVERAASRIEKELAV